jgi:hypothetical protein
MGHLALPALQLAATFRARAHVSTGPPRRLRGRFLGAIWALLVASGALPACKASEEFVSVGDHRDRTGPPQDGAADGGDDASSAGDADGSPPGATMDAAVLGLDASLMLPEGTLILADGAILLPDGQVIDVDAALMRFEAEPDLTACAISEEDTWQAQVDIDGQGGFALVRGPTGFGLAYRSLGGTNCPQNIAVAHLPASNGFPDPQTVLAECAAITDVALASTSAGWHLSWVDNLTQSAELHVAALDSAMKVASGGRRTLTDNEHQLERKPVIEPIAGRPLLVWSALDIQADSSRLGARWLDGDGEEIELVAAAEQHNAQGLALSQVGAENAVVGWVGPEENPGVWLLRLDASGTRVDAPLQLTERVAVSSSIDFAQRGEGGAAVYSIEIDGEPQVRFRRLAADGAPIADERVIIGPPLRGQDASIAPLAGGYVIVYRALPGGSIEAPEVRMTFVSKEGDALRDAAGSVRTLPIAPATIATARTSVVVSVEGQIMLAWLDADPSSKDNALRVVRRRLDCD